MYMSANAVTNANEDRTRIKNKEKEGGNREPIIYGKRMYHFYPNPTSRKHCYK
jgi:hypothetical protein